MVSNALTTSKHPEEVSWSIDNLPLGLFRLEPPSDYGNTILSDLLDQRGGIVRDAKGRPYSSFAFLPDQLSVKLEAYRMESYNREDPRLGYRDLLIRMKPDTGHILPRISALNQQKCRFRNNLNLTCWIRRSETPSMNECLLIEQLSNRSIDLNTTLGVDATGLILPGAPAGTLPINTFLIDNGNFPHTPSQRLQNVRDVIADLQRKARVQNLAHWIFLRNIEKPQSWITKAKGQNKSVKGPASATFPACDAMPKKAFERIQDLVRQSAAGTSGLIIPPLDRLPKHSLKWIIKCIEEGGADSSLFWLSAAQGSDGEEDRSHASDKDEFDDDKEERV